MSRTHFSKVLFALLALAVFTGTLQAANTISFSPAPASNTIALTCDVVSGALNTVNIPVVASAAGISVTATVTGASGTQGVSALTSAGVNGTGNQLVITQTVGTSAVNFGFKMAAGCRGATNGGSVTVTFTAPSIASITATATIAVTSTTSTALTSSASAVVLTCTKATSVGPDVKVNITSAALGGTNFYVDQTVPVPSWFTVSPMATSGAPNQANPGPVVLTFSPQAACESLNLGSNPTTPYQVTLANPPGAPLKIPVTVVVGNVSPLSAASANAMSIVYTRAHDSTAAVKGSTSENISASSAGSVFFTVDTASLPNWLNVSPSSGTLAASTSTPITFAATDGAATLPLGAYSAYVHFKVTNAVDLVVQVNLQVQSAVETLAVVENHTQSVAWTLGTAYPSFTITPISTDSPIGYSVSISDHAGTTLPLPNWNPTHGMAYSFGSPVSITFPAGTFASSAPGDAPQWDVRVTNLTDNSHIDCTITVNVQSPGARITSAMPTALSTAAPGTSFNLTLNGSGFVNGGDTQKTVVGVIPQTGQPIVLDSGTIKTITVVNSTTIAIVITVPVNPDPYFPFANGGSVTLGVCNPNGTSCSTPVTGGSITINIGGGPIIQAVTSASSFIQATSPALTTVAPFDIISIFGSNLCVANGTGCNGDNTILYGQVTASGPLQYVTTLSPDLASAGAAQRFLTVTFQTHTTPPTPIGVAPLLFATNSQINAIVPEAVFAAALGKVVDIVVSFGPIANPAKSAAYSVLIGQVDPGVFTVGSAGAGPAAALDKNYSLVSDSNYLSLATSASDSVSLYVTGLGEPDATTAGVAWTSTTCMAVSDYLTAANNSTSPIGNLLIDGLVFQSNLFPTGWVQPCLKSGDTVGAGSNLPSVTIGGLPGTVTYAGFVPDSVAGLYQINVTLPTGTGAAPAAFTAATPALSNFTDANGAPVTVATLKAGTTLPVVITARNTPSQAGVTLSVKARLTVTGSAAIYAGSIADLNGRSANYGVTTLTITGGSGTYTVTTDVMPTGLHVTAATGAVTTVGSGTPVVQCNTAVTFTVTDTVTGLTGTAVIIYNIGA